MSLFTNALKPEILLLNLCERPSLEETWKELFELISEHAILKQATSAEAAIRYLELHIPLAILATDEGVAHYKNDAAIEKVLQYTGSGGTLIIGFYFPTAARWMELTNFFQIKCKLPWATGSRSSRWEYNINHDAALPRDAGKLVQIPKHDVIKCTLVMYALPDQRILIPIYDPNTEDELYPRKPQKTDHEAQTAIAGANYGLGYIAYVGDDNIHKGSHSERVIMSLLGFTCA